MKQTFFHIFSTVGVVLALTLAGCATEGTQNQEAHARPHRQDEPCSPRAHGTA